MKEREREGERDKGKTLEVNPSLEISVYMYFLTYHLLLRGRGPILFCRKEAALRGP